MPTPASGAPGPLKLSLHLLWVLGKPLLPASASRLSVHFPEE